MISRSLGKSITEYKLENYNDVVFTYKDGYVLVNQWDSTPKNLSEVKFDRYGNERIKQPKCGYGQILYGIEPNGDLTQLWSIIDSSD